jgi:type II secretory pathway pseudopilin PulG
MLAVAILGIMIYTAMSAFAGIGSRMKANRGIMAMQQIQASIISYVQNSNTWGLTIAANDGMAVGGISPRVTMSCLAPDPASATPLAPLAKDPNCPNGFSGAAPFPGFKLVMYNATNGTFPVYDSAVATSGFDTQGQICNTFDAANGNDACPIKVSLVWSLADCAPANATCPSAIPVQAGAAPDVIWNNLVRVQMTFSYRPSLGFGSTSLNTNKYNISILR